MGVIECNIFEKNPRDLYFYDVLHSITFPLLTGIFCKPHLIALRYTLDLSHMVSEAVE